MFNFIKKKSKPAGASALDPDGWIKEAIISKANGDCQEAMKRMGILRADGNGIIYSDEFIHIPAEFKVIAIRANHRMVEKNDSTSKYFETYWSGHGSMESVGGRGLFAILPTQDHYYIESITYKSINPIYLVLEVDSRDIVKPHSIRGALKEIEFTKCNILFRGNIFKFINYLKPRCYTQPHFLNKPYQKLYDALDYKAAEIAEAYKSKNDYLNYVNNHKDRMKKYVIHDRNKTVKLEELSMLLIEKQTELILNPGNDKIFNENTHLIKELEIQINEQLQDNPWRQNPNTNYQ